MRNPARTITFAALCATLVLPLAAAPRVDYTALSDAARKSGQLRIYDGVPTTKGRLTVGQCTLDYAIPKRVRAYDSVPISYTLHQPAGARRAAFEAVAFEDPAKAKGRPLYDLAIPGDLRVNIKYLGSMGADYENDKYIPLTPDPKTPISPFPPYKRGPFVTSSTVKAAHVMWFKLRVTNTGDTILDPEGLGATLGCPWIRKIGPGGKVEWSAQTVNLYDRRLNYVYPGESYDLWVNYYCPTLGAYVRGLSEGDYRIGFTMLYKYHRDWNWGINIWHGKDFAYIEVPIKVTKTGGQTSVAPTFKLIDKSEKMPGYLGAFEEFMTSFRIHDPVESPKERKGTLCLQVAPWTKYAVLKLILTDPKQMALVRVPISVSDEALKIKYNPKNVMVVNRNGREEPAIMAMAMPGMRSGFQLGPYPEQHMLREIQEMRDLGVDLISNTAGGWWAGELTGRKGVELHSASYKYWYDVLMRKAGMKCVGWSIYPPTGTSWADFAAPLLGRVPKYSVSRDAYGGSAGIDVGDPIVPEIIAAWAKYNQARWGDYWFKTKDGRVPVEVEDTWGWLRDDVNTRYIAGPLAVGRFRDWVKAKYGSIESVNAAWGSSFKDLSEINPESNTSAQADVGSHATFHDWTPAMEDWDVFRTELRMDIYRKANEIMRKSIPGAEVALRTEGANLVIKGDPKSDSSHLRHVYYSQRRNAMVYDVIKKTDVLHFHNDYPALPYTEAEWRQAMREMVASGVIPMYLPQFDRMRDIVLNPYYDREYQVHYGLDKPTKGMMIQSLMAAYPWMKATYEEGGAPGIIWSDYLCDAFATETQKREVKLLRKYFGRMKR